MVHVTPITSVEEKTSIAHLTMSAAMTDSRQPDSARWIPAAEIPNEWSTGWRRIVAQQPQLHSPFFHPAFTQSVAAIRDDVHVAVLFRDDTPIGFLPTQTQRGKVAQPVAGPLNDFHGLIAESDVKVDPRWLCKTLGLREWRYTRRAVHRPDWQAWDFAEFPSWYVTWPNGYKPLHADWMDRHPRTFSDLEHRARKLVRQHGELHFNWHSTRRDELETLIEWKRSQYRRTGVVDVFGEEWTRRLIHKLWNGADSDIHGVLSVLRAGDRIVAAHFGLQCADRLHAWFPAYEMELARFSPGWQLWLYLIQACIVRGIRRLDLGRGDEPFKQKMATQAEPVAEGAITSSILRHQFRRCTFRTVRRVQQSRWKRLLKPMFAPTVRQLRQRSFR